MTAGIVLAGAPSSGAIHAAAPSGYREVVIEVIYRSGSYQGAFERLEPDDAKVSSPVLRGGSGGNAASPPDRLTDVHGNSAEA